MEPRAGAQPPPCPYFSADADLSLLARGPAPPAAFAGRTVWVTGASAGLGAAVARAFSAAGAHVVLSSRSRPRLEAVAASLTGPTTVLPLDVTAGGPALAEAAAAAAAAGAAAGGGRGVSVLVHCAGASQAAAAIDASPATLTSLLDVNAGAPMRLTAVALPFLCAAAPAVVVGVASMAAVVPSPGQAGYSAAKSALTMFLRSLDAEMRAGGVAAVVACPGPLTAPAGAPPRLVYGPQGLTPAPLESGSKGRVSLDRAAELVVAATHHRARVAWIAKHPVLFLAYATQYAPWLAAAVLARVGPGRAAALSAGRGGYDTGALLAGRGGAEEATRDGKRD